LGGTKEFWGALPLNAPPRLRACPHHISRKKTFTQKIKTSADFDATTRKYHLKKSATEGMGLIRAFHTFE